jgi:hypothetical protein
MIDIVLLSLILIAIIWPQVASSKRVRVFVRKIKGLFK